MKIYGIGTDIVHCDRIAKLWHEHGDDFARRILSNAELAQFAEHKQHVAFLAKRFAAKEAVAKALGTGFRDDVLITQIAIETASNGKPNVKFFDKTKAYVESLGALEVQVSISDEADYVVAFVIIIKN